MKKVLLINVAFALTTGYCCAAASSYESESLDGYLYALHKPRDDISLHVDVAKFLSERTIALSVMQAGEIRCELEVKGNHIFINRKISYGPISMHVAGGVPEGSLDRAMYKYAPQHPFFVLRSNEMHHVYNSDALQKCTNLNDVMSACSSSSDIVLAVDLRVWLNAVYTQAEKRKLPVRRVPKRVSLCTLTTARYKSTVLTQEEWEQYLCASMSKCILQ